MRSLPHKGFTLIELIITVAVMLIVTFVAIPAVTSMMDRKKVNDATTEIWSYIAMARSESAARSIPVYLIVDDYLSASSPSGMALGLDQNSVSSASSVCVPVTGSGCEIAIASTLAIGNVSQFTSKANIDIKTDIKEIVFDPYSSRAIKTIESTSEKTTEGASDNEFNISLDGQNDSYCKKITVGYLGQTNVSTGVMSSNLCQ